MAVMHPAPGEFSHGRDLRCHVMKSASDDASLRSGDDEAVALEGADGQV